MKNTIKSITTTTEFFQFIGERRSSFAELIGFTREILDEEVENILLPVYHQVLHDPAHYERLISILDNAGDDVESAAGAAVLVSMPSIIENHREESSPNEDYMFPMASIIRKIVSDKKIMKWCRDAYRAVKIGYASTARSSCITIKKQQDISIELVNRLSIFLMFEMTCLKMGRAAENNFKYFRDVLFHSCDDDAKSLSREFQLFYTDLAHNVYMAEGSVVYAVRLIGVSKLLFSNNKYHVYDYLLQKGFKNTGEKRIILSALEDQKKYDAVDGEYCTFLSKVMNTGYSDFQLKVAISECTKNKATNRCVAAVCKNRGNLICARCRMSHYCSKGCQLTDWKSKHKRICNTRRHKLAQIKRCGPC